MNPYFKQKNFTLYNDDCVKIMKEYPDNHFELAIVDPPYRDENTPNSRMRAYGDMKDFGKKPGADYFKELFRVSINQIIWGGNNFLELNLPYYGPITADQIRFHPTQKPVKLYEWLLKEYAFEGGKILDTHIGSMSIAIACHYQGFELVGCETNKSFCDQGLDRMEKETAQVSMF